MMCGLESGIVTGRFRTRCASLMDGQTGQWQVRQRYLVVLGVQTMGCHWRLVRQCRVKLDSLSPGTSIYVRTGGQAASGTQRRNLKNIGI